MARAKKNSWLAFTALMVSLSVPVAPFVATACETVQPKVHVIVPFTHKEACAAKRAEKVERKTSLLTKSQKPSSQAFRIDEALLEWHSWSELVKLSVLDDCSEARIRKHVYHIETEFRHTVRKEVDGKKFRFSLIG